MPIVCRSTFSKTGSNIPAIVFNIINQCIQIHEILNNNNNANIIQHVQPRGSQLPASLIWKLIL